MASRRRTWFTRILICLLLGAITTVAVAWLCIWLQPSRPPGEDRVMSTTSWPFPPPTEYPLNPTKVERRDSFGVTWVSAMAGPIDDFGEKFYRQNSHRTGLPFRALKAVDEYSQITWNRAGYGMAIESDAIGWQRGFRLIPRNPRAQNDGREWFPVTPIWFGFALDVMIHGVVWYVVLFLPVHLLGRIRRHRGKCVGCGYSLKDNVSGVCPECGTGVAKPRRERASAEPA